MPIFLRLTFYVFVKGDERFYCCNSASQSFPPLLSLVNRLIACKHVMSIWRLGLTTRKIWIRVRTGTTNILKSDSSCHHLFLISSFHSISANVIGGGAHCCLTWALNSGNFATLQSALLTASSSYLQTGWLNIAAERETMEKLLFSLEVDAAILSFLERVKAGKLPKKSPLCNQNCHIFLVLLLFGFFCHVAITIQTYYCIWELTHSSHLSIMASLPDLANLNSKCRFIRRANLFQFSKQTRKMSSSSMECVRSSMSSSTSKSSDDVWDHPLSQSQGWAVIQRRELLQFSGLSNSTPKLGIPTRSS